LGGNRAYLMIIEKDARSVLDILRSLPTKRRAA
jgi:hypothetical protein